MKFPKHRVYYKIREIKFSYYSKKEVDEWRKKLRTRIETIDMSMVHYEDYEDKRTVLKLIQSLLDELLEEWLK